MLPFILLFENEDRTKAYLRSLGLDEGQAQMVWDYGGKKYALFVARMIYGTEESRYSEIVPQDLVYPTAFKKVEEIINNLFEDPNRPKLPDHPHELVADLKSGIWQWAEQLEKIQIWQKNAGSGKYGIPRTKVVLSHLDWVDALEQAKAYETEVWERKVARGIETKEYEKVVITFEDGDYWLCLSTSSCRDEADHMGHCGDSGVEGAILYSLRTPASRELSGVRGKPVVTAALNDKGAAFQISAAGNEKPDEKYFVKISQLLKQKGVSVLCCEHGDGLTADDLENHPESRRLLQVKTYRNNYNPHKKTYTDEFPTVFGIKDGTLCGECEGKGNGCNYCDNTGNIDCDECHQGQRDCEVCMGHGSSECTECWNTCVQECPDCNGSGSDDDEDEDYCPTCEGEHEIECGACSGRGEFECDECDGQGTLDCTYCDGSGEHECYECYGDPEYHECSRCEGKGAET